jgi:hypothetical protein
MNRWRVGEDRGSKETDRYPLTMTEIVMTETMRMMRNDENGGNSEGMISDDDINWSRRVCWMSLIMRRTGAYSVSYILSM